MWRVMGKFRRRARRGATERRGRLRGEVCFFHDRAFADEKNPSRAPFVLMRFEKVETLRVEPPTLPRPAPPTGRPPSARARRHADPPGWWSLRQPPRTVVALVKLLLLERALVAALAPPPPRDVRRVVVDVVLERSAA